MSVCVRWFVGAHEMWDIFQINIDHFFPSSSSFACFVRFEISFSLLVDVNYFFFFIFRFLCWPRSQMPSVSSLHEYGPIGTRFNDFIIYSRFSFPIGAHSAAAGCYCWCCCKGTTNGQKRLADNIAIERTICIMKAPLNHHPHHDADQIWSLAHTQTKYWR